MKTRSSRRTRKTPIGGSVFARRRLTRLAVHNIVRNWMLDGCPMAGDVPPDEDEVWRILGRIIKSRAKIR